jgi:hypothetical protein
VFHARVLGDGERAICATIRTAFNGIQPVTRVELDLGEAPLPKDAANELDDEAASDRLKAVRETFATIRAPSTDRVELERPAPTRDPRQLFPAIEAFFAWLLDRRGERRQLGAYR